MVFQIGQAHFKNLAINVPDHFGKLWIKELKSFNLYVLTELNKNKGRTG